MSSRERILLLVVGILIIGVGGVGGGTIYYKKWTEANARIARAKDNIKKKEDEFAIEKDKLDRIHALSPRLKDWRKQSLPDLYDPKKQTQEAHLSRMHHAYQQYLTDVLNENGFQETTVLAGDFDNKATPKFPNDKERLIYGQKLPKDTPIYGVKPYSVSARGNLKSIIKVFEALHKMPVLHQVKTFKLVRPGKGTDKLKDDELKITMKIEVLQVAFAEKLVPPNSPEAQKQKDPRTDWLAKYVDSSQKPVVLASVKPRNYEDMVARHLFNLNPPEKKPDPPMKTPDPPMKTPDPPKQPDRPREKPEEVLPFVKLTRVDYTEGIVDWDEKPEEPDIDTGWVGAAVSYNVFRAPQCEAVLSNWNRSNVDEKTGQTSLDTMRFRMTYSTKRMRVPDFKILDKYDNLVLEGEGVRIERETKTLLLLINRKVYRMHVGDTLDYAMQKPLEEKELNELGIVIPKEPEKKPFEQTGPFKPEEKQEPTKPDDQKMEPSKVDEKKEPSMTERKKDK